MNANLLIKSNLIIHGASVIAGVIGAGLAQLPCSDTVALIPLQIIMIVALGAVFNKHITDTATMGCAIGVAAGYLGRFASQLLFGWIPFLGNFFNALTAFALTEIIGWVMTHRFNKP